MKLKFIDSKNRIRTVMCDADSLEEAYNDLIETLSYNYGPYFEEQINNFIGTLSEEEIINAKKAIARIALIDWEKVKDQEILVRNQKLLLKYMDWLDKKFPENPYRDHQYKFYWSDNWAKDQNNYSSEDPRKPITYETLKTRYFDDLDIYDGDMVDTKPNGDTIAYLWATKPNMDTLLDKIADLWTKSASGPQKTTTSSGKEKTVYTEVSPSELKKAKKGSSTLEEIEEYEEMLKSLNKTLESAKAENNPARVANLERIIEKNSNKLEKLKSELKELQALEKEEAELIENPESYTREDARKACILEDIVLPIKPDEISEPLIKMVQRDSKNWYNIDGMKLVYNFENSKIIKDSKSINYFILDKELQSKYYDSKSDNSYDEWLSNNKQIVLDTFANLTKEAKPVKDSLKNLKFRFKDGIEIEVLDSEGKTFEEVKDQAICIHRQVVNQNVKDDAKETEEVLEKYNAPATNDSKVEDFDLTGNLFGKATEMAVKEALEKEISKEDFMKDYCKGLTELGVKTVEEIFDKLSKETIEDSVEETSEDKFKVIVNGKEIGIYDTYEEAQEAEKKALEAVEKGIPKVDLEDDAEDTAEAEKIAYENAKECLANGVSKSDCDFQGLPDTKADEIWKRAFKDLAAEM